uniref:Uncharacterized protein n=1 Tax=Arundo donax TaxID=35708 RepID=A0A0A9GI29_ARUDO
MARKNVEATRWMLAIATGSSGLIPLRRSCVSIFLMFNFCDSSACSNLALNNAFLLVSVLKGMRFFG